MKKRSLIFGVALFVSMALIFSGCESPTDGSSGSSGLDGAVTLGGDSVDVDAAMLAAVFKVTDRILILPGTASVEGEIPAGKTLFVSDDIAVGTSTSATLEVIGVLEILEGAELDASGVSNAGYIWGTGSVTGEGEIGLPYLDGEVQGDDIPIIYTSANVSVAGKYAASYSTGSAPTAITADNLATIFGRTGDGAITALTVKNIETLTAAAIPANKTLTLIGEGNTFTAALDLSSAGNLVVKGTLEADASSEITITGNATTANITIADGATLTLGDNGNIAGKIENNGTITSAATAAATQKTLVTAPSGSGTVELSGAGDGAIDTAAVTLTQNVKIADSGKLTAPNVATPFSGGKTITVAEGGTLDLGATTTSVGVSVENEGSVTTATTSAAALNTILSIKGDITSTGAVAASVAITVAADTALTVADTASLAVAKDAPLTVAGDATLTVEGTLNVAAEAEVIVNGAFVLSPPSGSATNNGTLTGKLTIGPTGTAYSTGTFAYSDDGANVVKAGGTVYFSAPGTANAVPIIGGTGSTARLLLAEGEFILNSGGYTLAGNATLKKNFGINDIILTIKAGTTLTLTDIVDFNGEAGDYPGLWLVGTGTGKTTAIKGEAASGDTPASTIVVNPKTGDSSYFGKIVIQAGTGYNNIQNFYDSNGTKIAASTGANPQVVPDYGTYKWDATLGSDAGGWKAQATP